MILDEVKEALMIKIKDLNKKPLQYRNEVFEITQKLNKYLNKSINLTQNNIDTLVKRLTRFTTGSVIGIPANSKMTRAINFQEKDGNYYKEISRLSYIPHDKSHLIKLGRMNEQKKSIFYACLDNNSNSIGTALSEIEAKKDDKINLLFSKTVEEVYVVPIGMFDYFRRDIEHPFPLHEDFYEIYDFYKKHTNIHAMIALQLCDAFLTDVLTREGNDNLYNVTSIIVNDFLSEERLDGIIYPSVKFSGHPNIALKPNCVDKKIQHIETSSIIIKENFGYGLYQSIQTHKGKINSNHITWRTIGMEDMLKQISIVNNS